MVSFLLAYITKKGKSYRTYFTKNPEFGSEIQDFPVRKIRSVQDKIVSGTIRFTFKGYFLAASGLGKPEILPI